MSIHQGLLTHLKARAGITALVGSGDGARIYNVLAPSNTKAPYITFQRISDVGEHHMAGASGLTRALFQVDCWDDDASGVYALADAVRSAMDGFTGGLLGSFQVRSIFLENRRDGFEPPTDASQAGTWRVSMDFSVWYKETVPVLA